MRSSLVSALLGLSVLTACEVGDPGTGTGNGPDGGQAADASSTATPRFEVAVDKPTVATELMSRNMVTVTLTSIDGFTGTFALTAAVVDGGGQPLAAWPVTLNNASVSLTAGATTTAVATVAIPSENLALAGTLQIAAASGADSKSASSVFTVANQLTVPLSVVNNQCVYPAGMTATRVTIGTKVRFLNTAADGALRVHFGGTTGLDHAQVDTDVGSVYEDTATTAGTAGWYCHTPGNDPGNLSFNVVAP